MDTRCKLTGLLVTIYWEIWTDNKLTVVVQVSRQYKVARLVLDKVNFKLEEYSRVEIVRPS